MSKQYKPKCPKCGDEMVLRLKFEKPEKLPEIMVPLGEEEIEDAPVLRKKIYHCKNCGYDSEVFAVAEKEGNDE